jgi:RNA polymerase sigma-70 factor (ECF subfamily)
LKIIALHTSDDALIKKALRNDAKAEQMLYNRHASKMLGVCRTYIKDLHYAEDVMIQGFTRAFENLAKFRFEGSFEGWLRRIMVREAIDFLRTRRELYCRN